MATSRSSRDNVKSARASFRFKNKRVGNFWGTSLATCENIKICFSTKEWCWLVTEF